MAAVELRRDAAVHSGAHGEIAVAVEELGERGAISSLREEWTRVATAMRAAGWTKGPFLAPEWLSIYAASLCDPHDAARAGDFRLLVAHRAGRLVAALPLVVERRKLAGVPARVLRSLSDDHSQRFDLLLDPADADEAARALVAHLSRARDWDAVELQGILDEGAAAHALVAAAIAANFPIGEWASMRSPYLPLPRSAAELDKLQGSKFRGNLRRRAKKLEAEVGPLALERVDGSGLDAVQLDALLDEGLALEAAGWKGDAGTAIACDARLTARYRALAHAFAARGELACYFLRAGARRVAFHFALADADTYYLFKPGFDPALASFGLGHLLVDAVARDLIARGVRELDFLGDDMPWKRDWTDKLRAHSFRYLFAPTARGRAIAAWKFRLAPAAKRLWSRLHRS
ncbi:MAG TPA: GNAT family N-acetyltransferase [Polyangia bacterium]|jgi:CelD/BcsL family acetyltransferase involved in cellulose biosynthesis